MHWRGDAETLATRLSHADSAGMALTLITMKVWPDGYPHALLTDHWRCRFTLADGVEMVGNRALLDLLGRNDGLGISLVNTETLCHFGGRCGFSRGEARSNRINQHDSNRR